MLAAAGVAAAATIAVDQASKALVRSRLEPGEFHRAAGGQLAVGHVQNHGSAYGLLSHMPPWAPTVGTAVIGGAMLALNRGTSKPVLAGIGAGLVLGGGAGNVIDRLHQGHVTDFLHTTDLFGYYNVADVAINAGLALAGGALLFAAHR
jgi:signal peptidase II